MKKKVLIIGGVACGASCAARARRLSEDAKIVMVERGPHISFANCGLPYHIGGEIEKREKLLLQTPEKMKKTFNLDVRVKTEAIKINPQNKTVTLRDHENDREYEESYDALVLAMGAAPLRPAIPGIDRAGHFILRNVPDMDAIISHVSENKVKTATVIGGGYIGLEMAEQLHRQGLKVSIVEAQNQVMAPLDPDMAAILHQEIKSQGIDLYLGDPLAGFEGAEESENALASVSVLKSDKRIPGDMVILGLGVRPETALAVDAGIELGPRGGIKVNKRMETNVEGIYAGGDIVEVTDFVTKESAIIPLAGPANRQGRIIADNLFDGTSEFNETQGTAILRLFELSAACTGANEKNLKRLNRTFETVHLHPASHAGYYPGAHPISLKVIFDPENGKLLGAQAVGIDGIDKRIDVFATSLRLGATVDDLAELELAYAPPFGSAKDPVNLAGMIAQNIMRGLGNVIQWHEVEDRVSKGAIIVDVREQAEVDRGAIPGSKHIPLGELRSRLNEIPKEKEVIVHCHTGQRSWNATRILLQNGYNAVNLTGSWKTWQMVKE